jgi:hypothetical protein
MEKEPVLLGVGWRQENLLIIFTFGLGISADKEKGVGCTQVG